MVINAMMKVVLLVQEMEIIVIDVRKVSLDITDFVE